MKALSLFMQGKKTFAGLLLAVLGHFGFGELITEGDLATLISNIIELSGIAFAAYGRYRATK